MANTSESVAFMFDVKLTRKIKNVKAMKWRLEMSCFLSS